MGRVSIDTIVEAVNDLPMMPHIVVKIMELTEDPGATAQDIGNIISQDQSLTAKILRMANSAYYGYSRRIGTVTEAIVVLGFAAIRSLVLTASMSDLLNREVEGYALGPGELWNHSLGTAIAARWIARKTCYGKPEVAYTAGLLHDVGKVILNKHVKEAYVDVLEEVQRARMPFCDTEDVILGFNHADVGGRVARKWKLPREIIEAISLHHKPGEAERDVELSAIVHVADVVCATVGLGLGIDGLLYPVSKKAMDLLKIKEKDIENLISELGEIYNDLQMI